MEDMSQSSEVADDYGSISGHKGHGSHCSPAAWVQVPYSELVSALPYKVVLVMPVALQGVKSRTCVSHQSYPDISTRQIPVLITLTSQTVVIVDFF